MQSHYDPWITMHAEPWGMILRSITLAVNEKENIKMMLEGSLRAP